MSTKPSRLALKNNGILQILFLSLSILLIPGCANEHNTVSVSQVEKKLGTKFVNEGLTPQIVLIGHSREKRVNHEYYIAELVLVNTLDVPIQYYGYRMDSWDKRPPTGEISPFSKLEVKTAENPVWHDVTLTMECGTGRGTMAVPPKRAGRFKTLIQLPVLSARVGFHCSWVDSTGKQQEMQIWSEEIKTESARMSEAE
jgi:hypothetical protein